MFYSFFLKYYYIKHQFKFQPTWSIVDPICTFLFSILVILTTVAIIKDVVNVLMEGIPKGFEYSQVENTFMQIDGVVKVHNLRIWALSLDKTALSAHLAISTLSSKNIIQYIYFLFMYFTYATQLLLSLEITYVVRGR